MAVHKNQKATDIFRTKQTNNAMLMIAKSMAFKRITDTSNDAMTTIADINRIHADSPFPNVSFVYRQASRSTKSKKLTSQKITPKKKATSLKKRTTSKTRLEQRIKQGRRKS